MMVSFSEAEKIYRRMHPREFPYSPWGRQLELRDLWPDEQQKFIDTLNEYDKQLRRSEP